MKGKISCADVKNGSWLKLNYGQHVPVRVLYPGSMLQRLSANVSALSPEDKIGLLSDTYAIAKSGGLDPIQLATLLKGFDGETNDKVWAELSSVIGGVSKIIQQGV